MDADRLKTLEKRLRFISTMAGRGFGLSLYDGKQIVAAADALEAASRNDEEFQRIRGLMTTFELGAKRAKDCGNQSLYDYYTGRTAGLRDALDVFDAVAVLRKG